MAARDQAARCTTVSMVLPTAQHALAQDLAQEHDFSLTEGGTARWVVALCSACWLEAKRACPSPTLHVAAFAAAWGCPPCHGMHRRSAANAASHSMRVTQSTSSHAPPYKTCGVGHEVVFRHDRLVTVLCYALWRWGVATTHDASLRHSPGTQLDATESKMAGSSYTPAEPSSLAAPRSNRATSSVSWTRTCDCYVSPSFTPAALCHHGHTLRCRQERCPCVPLQRLYRFRSFLCGDARAPRGPSYALLYRPRGAHAAADGDGTLLRWHCVSEVLQEPWCCLCC
jgi:hypothetical protein